MTSNNAQEVESEAGDVNAYNDKPAPCVMTHTPPYDFAQCETHDETFPLGNQCKFHGRDSVAEVYAEEADRQRARAVVAEMSLEVIAELHQPMKEASGEPKCVICTSETTYPCATVKAIKFGPLSYVSTKGT